MEYADAKLAAQRRLDDISLSLTVYLDGGDVEPVAGGEVSESDGEFATVEMELVYVLASVCVGESGYLDRGFVYAIPPGDAEMLMRWGRVRAVTEDEADSWNREAEQWAAAQGKGSCGSGC